MRNLLHLRPAEARWLLLGAALLLAAAGWRVWRAARAGDPVLTPAQLSALSDMNPSANPTNHTP